MEANRPISPKPTATPRGEVANPVKTAPPPMPKSITASIPVSLQRSASHPAGSAPTPNSTKLPSESESSSP